MPRPKSKSRSKPKASPRDNNSTSINHSPSYEAAAPPSSPMPHIPYLDCGEGSSNQELPLSCARDEPGTKPLLEPFVFVPIPSPPPKRGKKSRSRRSAANNKPARSLNDQENISTTTSSTSKVVANTKVKRGKIQVQESSRILRPRGCQLLSKPKKESLHGNTSESTFRLIQGKENEETPYWAVSWDKWAHVRGTIRQAK